LKKNSKNASQNQNWNKQYTKLTCDEMGESA